jgi:hypothetical protein
MGNETAEGFRGISAKVNRNATHSNHLSGFSGGNTEPAYGDNWYPIDDTYKTGMGSFVENTQRLRKKKNSD